LIYLILICLFMELRDFQ